ncbi:MAG TPA: CopD family protein [Methylocella sp.]|nr:CopD family protein [Methylocella sp.]
MIDPFAIVRAFGTLGAAIVVGTGALIWYTRDALVPAGGTIWRHRVVLAVLIASIVSAIATTMGVIGAAAAAAEIGVFSVDGSTIETFLFKTGVGRIAILEIGFAAATCAPAVIAWVTLKNTKVSDVALLAAALIAAANLATVPFASHPITLDAQIVGVLSAIVHRLALSLWLGGLPALILLIGAGPVPDDARRVATLVLRRFSHLATAAMGAILLTGALLTWFLVGNFPGLIGTEYGRLLIIKLILLGGVLFIAGGLQRHLLPLLELKPSDPTLRSYANRVKLETIFAVLIVVIASDMAGLAPPEHENIVWPLPFRFSFAATWAIPWVPTRFIGGSALILCGIGTLGLGLVPALRPAWFSLSKNILLGAGTAVALIGGGLAFPAISVQAYPDTYLTTDIPYAARSIAAGLKHYEDNCTGCHGTSGHGDGPLASSLPIKPADLSAPHTALHTGGDLYWWVTHGIENSPMPAFGDALTDDERWDIINFLGAFSVGYQGRIIEPRVQLGQYWLAPPDFELTDENGKTNLLGDYRLKSPILLVLFSCTPENIAQETARFNQLLAAREQLASKGAKIALVAPGKLCEPLRNLAAGKILVADHDIPEAAATFGLFTRSFHNRQQTVVRVPETHAEFLIDRSGYIRARWLPVEDDSWSDPSFIETQLELLSREPPAPPPPGPHDH